MRYWLEVRGSRAGAVTVVTLLVLLVVVGDLAIPMLSLAAFAEYALPVSLVAPVVLAIFVTWSLARGDERLEGVAVMPVAGVDAVLVLGITGSFACVAVVFDIATITHLGVEAARNAIGLVGLALMLRWLVGSDVAGVLPVAYVVIVAFFGGETPRTAEWWAWLVRPAGSTTALVQAAALFAAGLIVTSLGRREPPALR